MAILKFIGLIITGFLIGVKSESSSCELDFINNHNDFTNNFYSTLINKNYGKNIAFSPASLQTAFAMLFMGTKGITANELESAFCLGSSDRNLISNNFKKLTEKYTENKQLQLLNKIYVDLHANLEPQFQETATNNFKAEIEKIDLTKSEVTSMQINNWIKSKTNNKIDNLIKSEDCNSDSRLFLLNVIYFKGLWSNPFKVENTNTDEFFLTKDKTINVQMMNIRQSFKFKSLHDLKANLIELPYANSEMSMLILVPNEIDGLQNLEQNLKKVPLDYNELLSSARKQQIEFYLPKFKVENEIDLKDILSDMNVKHLFEGANLDDLATADRPLYISKAVHKVIVEVDEEGTEAAAATNLGFATRVGPRTFKANRPFLFIIRDKSGNNFFMGRVVRPETN